MLELLVTSHGSSGSRGAEQGTGCSWGLRAIHVPGAGKTRGGESEPQREGERKRKGGGEKKRERNGKEKEEKKQKERNESNKRQEVQ